MLDRLPCFRPPWLWQKVANRVAVFIEWPSVLVTAVALLLTPVTGFAQTVPSDANSMVQGVTFYRAFVPSEMIRQVSDYFPMKRQDFARRLQQINERFARPLEPYIQLGEYSARFADGHFVDGMATLTISIPDKRATTLLLGKVNLAVKSARWRASLESAQIGTNGDSTSGIGATESTVLVIPAAIAAEGQASLELNWSLAGMADAFGAVEFNLQLPRAVSNRLSVSTSVPVEATTDLGLIEHSDDETRLPNSTQHSPFRLDLGEASNCKLVVARQTATTARSLVMYRQHTDYRMSLAGSDINTRIVVQKPNQPVRRFTLEADDDLQIRTIHWNGLAVPWRSDFLPFLDKQLLSFEVPQPGSNIEDELQIDATSQLPFEKLTALPMIRPLQTLWQSGTARVEVADDLKLQNYELRQAHQLRRLNATNSKDHTAPQEMSASSPYNLSTDRHESGPTDQFKLDSESSLNVEYESPNATISLRLAASTPSLEIAQGVTAIIRTDLITADTVVELRQFPAVWFRLFADIGPNWVIEDVTSDQTDLIGDWDTAELVANGGEANDNARTLLEIALRPDAKSSMPRTPRFQIRASRKMGDEITSLSQEDITPLKFRDTDYVVDLRALRSAGDLRLELVGQNAVSELSAKSLVDVGEDLVDVVRGDRVYAVNQQTSTVRIELQPAEPQFVASSDVTLRVGDSLVSEEIVIRWTPQDSGLDRVLVHLSQARSEPTQWSLVEPSPREFPTPRRLAQDEQERARFSPGGETWQFTMPDLGTSPRTVRGYREFSSPDGAKPIVPALVMLPDARSQHAMLNIQNSSAISYQIETAAGVESTLAHPSREPAVNSMMTSYRYLPERHAVSKSQAIQLVPDGAVSAALGQQSLQPCWAWDAKLDSHFSPDGRTQHRFRYQVENHGRRWIELSPMADLEIRRIMIGDLTRTPDEGQSGAIRVELPNDQSQFEIIVDAVTKQSPSRFFNRLSAPVVRLDIPVVHAQWIVWLPKDYRPMFLNQRVLRSSQSWTQQLFGTAGKHAQRLGMLTSIKQFADAGRLETDAIVDSFLAELDSYSRIQPSNGQRMTWGRMFSDADNNMSETSIIVDEDALAEEGILPNRPIELVAPSDSMSHVLESAGVIFLRDGRRLIITTNRRRGLYSEDFAETIWPNVFLLRDGTLATVIHQGAGYLTTEAWQFRLHAEERGAWKSLQRTTLASERNLDAWCVPTTYNSAGGEVVAHVHIVRTQFSHVLGWIGFLISYAMMWQKKRSLAIFAWILLAVGLLTLVSIPAIQPVAWGLLAGLPVGYLQRYLRNTTAIAKRRANKRADVGSTVVRSAHKSLSGITSVVIWGIVGLGICGAQVLWAQDSSPSVLFARDASAHEKKRSDTTESLSRSHRVLFPVDKEQQPDGDYLFLPVEFYKQLIAIELTGQETPDWLIRSADYRGRLVPSRQRAPDAGDMELSDLNVTFLIETFRPNTIVRIPFPRDSLDPRSTAATLDGRMVGLTSALPAIAAAATNPSIDPRRDRNFDKGSDYVLIAMTGTHRLRLNLRDADTVDSQDRYSIKVPSVPDSTITLDTPRQVDVRIPSAVGTSRWSDTGQLVCDLGPTDRLTVAWQGMDEDNRSAKFSARLLSLLEVQPSQTFLSVRIQVQPSDLEAESLPKTVDLTFANNMQWLPMGNPPVSMVDSPLPESSRLRIALNDKGTTVAPIRFSLNSLSSPNRAIRMPKISLESLDIVEHWLGVITDPSLATTYSADAEGIAPAVFVDAWQDDSTDIDAAFQVRPSAKTWAITVQPIESAITSDEVLELSIQGTATELQYRAQVEVTGISRYKHRLQTPVGMKITEIIVTRSGRRIRSNWSQTDDATFLFFDEPLIGSYEVSLAGTLATPDASTRPVPMIWLSDAKKTSHSVQLFRKPNTQLSVTDYSGFHSVQQRRSYDVARQTWRVADLQSSTPEIARATIDFIDAAPSVSAQILTTLNHEESNWIVSTELHFNVLAGSVDMIAMDLPQSWQEPQSVTPSHSYQTIEMSGGRRRLYVWLDEPVRDAAQFSLRAVLAPNEVIAVAEIRPVNFESLESFVRIPTATTLERLTWATRRLLVSEIPDRFSAPADGVEYSTYRAASGGYRAELTTTRLRENLPHVGLTEVHYVIGRQVDFAVATFHIEPAGAPSTVLTMPRGSELMNASIGETSTQLTRVDDSRWQVSLGATRLPHRLRVAYRLTHGVRSDGTWRLLCPTLTLNKNNNGRVLWTVTLNDDTRQECIVDEFQPLSDLDFALARVTSLRQVFEAPDVSSIDYSDPETVRWYSHWDGYSRQRINSAKELLLLPSSSTPADGAIAAKNIAEVEAKLVRIQQQLGLDSAQSDTTLVARPASPTLTSYRGSQTNHYATGPGTNSLDIQCTMIGRYDHRMRLLAGMIMVLAGVAIGCNCRTDLASSVWETWLRNQKDTLLILLGAIWWFALFPPWLGALLIVAGVVIRFAGFFGVTILRGKVAAS